MMALAGISGIIAIVGGGMYLLITVWSVFLGKKIETPGFQHVRARDGLAAPRRTRQRAGDRRARLGGHGGAGAPSCWRWCSLAVRAVLLRQLEVPLDGVAAEVNAFVNLFKVRIGAAIALAAAAGLA